jgi:hypothetical protein
VKRGPLDYNFLRDSQINVKQINSN